MASKTSYAYQRELLIKLKDQLEVFKDEMSAVSVNYKTSIENLHTQGGLMDETYEEYSSNYVKPTVEAISNMIVRIETEDIAFLEKEIDFLGSR